MPAFFIKHKTSFLYGAAMAALLFLLKWLELRFTMYYNASELYMGAIAIIFTSLGIWLALKLSKPRVETLIVEKEIYIQAPSDFKLNEDANEKTGLSKRELEVLQLMAEGLSNQEIAGRLFLSLSTIKTHSSRVFEKLDVKRRTQAIEKGKRLSIIQ